MHVACNCILLTRAGVSINHVDMEEGGTNRGVSFKVNITVRYLFTKIFQRGRGVNVVYGCPYYILCVGIGKGQYLGWELPINSKMGFNYYDKVCTKLLFFNMDSIFKGKNL